MQINGHYAVQGHARSLLSAPTELLVCDFCVNNANLHPILHRFQDMAYYWSPSTGGEGTCFSITAAISYRYNYRIATHPQA